MNILPKFILMLLTSLVSQAAITITISPGTLGTNFSVTQTSLIPLIELSPYYIGGIPIATGAIAQEPNAVFFTREFPTILGTFGTQFGDVGVQIIGFSYYYDSDTNLYRPGLDCIWFIADGPFVIKSDQLQQTSSTPSAIQIDFSEFVIGTHVSSDAVFGEITTVVIPEPRGLLLASIGSCFLLRRRRTASV